MEVVERVRADCYWWYDKSKYIDKSKLHKAMVSYCLIKKTENKKQQVVKTKNGRIMTNKVCSAWL